jgi:hypothetical protein
VPSATAAARTLAYVYFEKELGHPALRPARGVLHRSMGLATLA